MTITWTNNVWSQERTLITITGFNASAKSVLITCNLTVSEQVSATYAIPASDTLTVDLSDLIRLAPSGEFYIYEKDATGTTLSYTNKEWFLQGSKNPFKDVHLKPAYFCALADEDFADAMIVAPPSMILKTNSNINTIAEVWCTADIFAVNYGTGASTVDAYSYANMQATFPTKTMPTGFYIVNEDTYDETDFVNLTPRYIDEAHVFLRWRSRYGITKQFMWRLREFKDATNNTISLDTINNTFDVRKGVLRSFVAALDKLDAYDLWYYSDIITSSKVEACIVSAAGGYQGWERVEVTNSEVTYPDGNNDEWNELKIQVNWRKYDAV